MGARAREHRSAVRRLRRRLALPYGWVPRAGLAVLLAAAPLAAVFAAEILIYGFEGSLDGWVIPDWAKASADYVGKSLDCSEEVAEEGASSMKLEANFPGERWTGVYAERMVEVTDWTDFGTIRLSVYLPPEAPEGLRGRIILTVGSQWTWTEMNRSLLLAPGQWTAISANLKPGGMDWKFFPDDQFRSNVRKLGVRIESDKKPAYSGPVYFDNFRLEE